MIYWECKRNENEGRKEKRGKEGDKKNAKRCISELASFTKKCDNLAMADVFWKDLMETHLRTGCQREGREKNLSASCFQLLSFIDPSLLHWALLLMHFWIVLHCPSGSHPREARAHESKDDSSMLGEHGILFTKMASLLHLALYPSTLQCDFAVPSSNRTYFSMP